MTKLTTTAAEKAPHQRERSAPNRFQFTEAKIEALKPSVATAGWVWSYDTRMPGLAVGVGRSGTKGFYFIRKIDGKTRRVAIGKYPMMTVEMARKSANAMNAKVMEGTDPTRKSKDAFTFGDLFEQYMKLHARRRNRASELAEDVYNRYLSTNRYGVDLSSVPLRKVTKQHIRTVIMGVSEHAPVQANRVLALIRSIFNRAIAWDMWTGDNPCRGIDRNVEVARERFVSQYEMPFLFRSLELEENTTARDFVYMALLTGARRGNVLPMRWDEIDFESSLWRIGMTKNGTSQTVPLVPEAIAILKARREDIADEWVFPANSMTGHYVDPKKAWKTILDRATGFRIVEKLAESNGWTDHERERALSVVLSHPAVAVKKYSALAESEKISVKPLDMRDIRVHDLRRTLGSWQANLNISLPIIGRTLNHKSPLSTAIYARISVDPVRDAMARATTAMLQHRVQPAQ